MTAYPIVGKFYKVIAGRYNGFIGECVSFDLTNTLPVILQDLEYNSRAVKLDEIEPALRQPGKPDTAHNQQS